MCIHTLLPIMSQVDGQKGCIAVKSCQNRQYGQCSAACATYKRLKQDCLAMLMPVKELRRAYSVLQGVMIICTYIPDKQPMQRQALERASVLCRA